MTSTNGTHTVSPIAQIKALHNRLIKADALVAEDRVHPVVNLTDRYIVQGSKGFYLVNGTCECPDAVNRNELTRGYCKHRLAALLYDEAKAETPKATHKATADSPQDEELESKVADLYH